MLADKQNELMSDLLFTVHQHCGDDVTRKPPITIYFFQFISIINQSFAFSPGYKIYSVKSS